MAQFSYFFLLNGCNAAFGALLTLGKAGFGTGGSLTCDDLLGVTEGINYILLNQYLTAYIAVLAFGRAGFSAGGILCCVYYFGVTFGRHYFLF